MCCSTTMKNLTSYIKQVIEKDYDWTGTGLTKEDLTEILKDNEDICDSCVRKSIIGYPTRPLYREIANMVSLWMESGQCPVQQLPNFHLLDEQSHHEERNKKIEQVTQMLEATKSLWNDITEDEKSSRCQDILKALGRRGILDLLGIRKTVGTVELWPCPRKVLQNTFQELHKPDSASKLTVGARALSKHCHRDHSLTWWGQCSGKEIEKNEHASEIMNRILDSALWINIHHLPHDIHVIETRQEHGYGLRWTADGLKFRGFVEPQMEDGHEVGWRH